MEKEYNNPYTKDEEISIMIQAEIWGGGHTTFFIINSDKE